MQKKIKKVLKNLENLIKKAFLPVTKQIPVKMKHGIAAGLNAKGALPYTNIFKNDNKEDIFLKKANLKDKVIYDIGAFIGLTTLFFAHRSGDNGFVYAFEPNKELFNLVLKNIELNALSNVQAYNFAIGEKNETKEMFVSSNHAAMGSLSKEHMSKENSGTNSISVEVKALDTIIKEYSLRQPDFIKIDVEGYELNVLAGMYETLKKDKPELFIEIHGILKLKELYNLVYSYDYSIYHVENDIFINKDNIDLMKYGHIYCE